MPNVFQLYDGGETQSKDKGQGGDARLRFGVSECSDEATATALVRAYAPLAVAAGSETLVRQSIKTQAATLDFFELDVSYGPEDDEESKEPPQPGTWKFEFDTTGAKQLITTAPLVSRHGSSTFGEAPDLQGAINWDGKTVKGVEVPVPNAKFTIVQYLEARLVTVERFKNYARATPRVNSDTWLTFDPGEVLYLGSKGQGDIPLISGQRVAPIAIRHEFDASENRIVDDIEGIEQSGKYGPGAFDANGASLNGQPASQLKKKGWEYLWIWFKKRDDEDFSKVVPRPAHAFVHAPIRTMNFAAFFGFGGS